MKAIVAIGLGAGLIALLAGCVSQEYKDERQFVKLLEEGDKHNAERQFDLAVDCYSKAIEMLPRLHPKDRIDFVPYGGRAAAYLYSNRPDLALADCNTILAGSKHYKAYALRGAIYFAEGQYDKALADANAAIAGRPTTGLGYWVRGMVYSVRDEYAKAIPEFTTAIENYKKMRNAPEKLSLHYGTLMVNEQDGSAATYLQRGTAYAQSKAYDKALADFNAALAADPNLAEAYLAKGFLFEDMGRKKEAVEAYREFLKHTPVDPAEIGVAKARITALEK
jgi:tetratricopeptide (TPR) repeat protein